MQRHGNDRRVVIHEVLRTVEARQDGQLPLDVAGVAEIFDADTLLSVLQTKWYSVLVGAVERSLVRLADPEMAVVAGWKEAAAELPGLRMLLDRALDRALEQATDQATGQRADSPLLRALAKEHQMLAVMAGLEPTTPGLDDAAVALGRELEHVARVTRLPARQRMAWRPHVPAYPGILSRLKAVIAA